MDVISKEIYLLVFSMGCLLLVSGFFSGTETAFFNLNAADKKRLLKKGRIGNLVVNLQKKPRTLLLVLLIGNMISNILYFIISSIIIIKIGTDVKEEILFGLLTLLAIVLFGEVIPKFLAAQRPVLFSSISAIPISLIYPVAKPLDKLISFLVIDPIQRLIGTNQNKLLEKSEIEEFVKNATKLGEINFTEQNILQAILSLRQLHVKDVMTPRVNMYTVSKKEIETETKKILSKRLLTQVPIYENNLDNITGILHTKRWLCATKKVGNIENFISKPHFVPSTITLEKLLEVMKSNGIKTSIVIDEYGGTAGIVSVEDVIEEIIGDIEHHKSFLIPERVSDGVWVLDGNTPIEICRETFGLKQKKKSSATIGVLLSLHLGHLPKKGDIARVEDFEIEVREVTGARVTRATVRLLGGEK